MRFLILLSLFVVSQHAQARKTVNPIIKDLSFFTIMGHAPDEHTNEQKRIACHLLYAEFLLRTKDVSHLSFEKRKNRKVVLDLLHEYILVGRFPKNFEFPSERKPCFIDRENNICAVGYLIEKTAGAEAAKEINERYQYAEIFEMDQDLISAWAEQNGLTLRECAIIQPTYDWQSTKTSSIEANGLVTYRGMSQFTWGAQLMYIVSSIPFKPKLLGWGAEFQRLQNNGYSGAIRLQGAFFQLKYVLPYFALNTEMFWINGRNGMNLKPEFGLFHNYLMDKFYVHAAANYGYHFALSNKENYSVGRHNIGLSLGIGYRL